MVGNGGHFRSVLTRNGHRRPTHPPASRLQSDLSRQKIKPISRTNQAPGKFVVDRHVHDASVLAWARPVWRTTMPLIEVHLIEKVFSSTQKRQIIEKLTDAMVTVEGENMRGVTTVKISGVAIGRFRTGGKPLTTEAVKEIAA